MGNGRSEANRLEPIVESLSSDKGEIRSRAMDELQELADLGLSPEEGVYALQMAAQIFPPLTEDWLDVSEELVSAVAGEPRLEHIPVIREHFDLYSPRAQGSALHLLGTLENREATEAFTALLDEVSEEAQVMTLGTMTENPRHADVLFPEIIRHVRRPPLQMPLSSLILAHLSSQTVIDPLIRSQISTAMIEIYGELRAKLAPLQKSEGLDWMWDDAYQEPRSLTTLVLDVLGQVDTPEAERELLEALEYKDPRLKLFALLGLLGHGKEPPREPLVEVAASSDTRNWLYRGLTELDRLDLFPTEYATQEAFAEGETVNWLTHPTQLGRVPDEIELMAVLPETYEDVAAEIYVFRFRTLPPHWAAKEGWMASMAGPFLRTESPSPEARGGTFSTFSAWDMCSPEEHLARMREPLERSRENRQAQ